MNREIGEMSFDQLAARAAEFSYWDTSNSLENTASAMRALAEIVAELCRRQEAPKGEGDELAARAEKISCGDTSNNLRNTASAMRALAEIVAELCRRQEAPRRTKPKPIDRTRPSRIDGNPVERPFRNGWGDEKGQTRITA